MSGEENLDLGNGYARLLGDQETFSELNGQAISDLVSKEDLLRLAGDMAENVEDQDRELAHIAADKALEIKESTLSLPDLEKRAHGLLSDEALTAQVLDEAEEAVQSLDDMKQLSSTVNELAGPAMFDACKASKMIAAGFLPATHENTMKLVVFGSTGGTGRELVKQALEQDHMVTAFARNPVKIDDIEHANLRVIPGDVLDPATVAKAVAGQDAVFCTIGAGAERTTLREEGTRNIVAAMEKDGVQRLVCQSSLGVGDSRANLQFFTKYIVVSVFLRHAFADHERQEAVVKQSSLDWIIVRPPHLKDGSRTGIYRHGFPVTDKRIKGKISRADVADFMLKQLTDDAYLHQTPGVSY